MAKGQKRSNREIKKPKADKTKDPFNLTQPVQEERESSLDCPPGVVALVDDRVITREDAENRARMTLRTKGFDESDPERYVPHPQPGVATLFGIGPRPTPVLLEEHPQPVLGGVEFVFGVQRAQHLVLTNQRVEAGHDGAKRLGATHRVVERLRILGHATIVYISIGPTRRGAHVTRCSRI